MTEEMINIPRSIYEAEKKMRFFGNDSHKKGKFNIFIGISISNKRITKKMIKNYLNWALQNTKKYVAFVIADELNIVNYRILDKYSSGKAINRAKKVGDKLESMIKSVVEEMNESERERIRVFRWKQIKEDPHYTRVHNFLKKVYINDSEFKSAILYFIKKYMRKRGKIIKDEGNIDKLATYIIGELPTLFDGIMVDGIHYNLCIYPTFFASGMSQFVMDVHEEELDIGRKIKKLLKGKAVLVEAWLD